MIRLIFCDVDGTLVQDNDQGEYTISVENLQEINKTMNSGVHFALATGRPADFGAADLRAAVQLRYGCLFRSLCHGLPETDL